jgi:hypothetical protein
LQTTSFENCKVGDLLARYAKKRDHSHLKGVQQDVAILRIQGVA